MSRGDRGDREGSREGRAAVAPAAIAQIAVPVIDAERATGFYRDVMGLPHLFSAPPGLSFFRCGEVRLMLTAAGADEGDPAPAPLIYYRVSDVEQAHDRLGAAAVEVVADPHVVHRADDLEVWIGFYRDSESNLFATMAEVTRTS